MICGGSISGKSASGRPDIAISPVITVRIAITIATIGRLIKKLEIIYSLTFSPAKTQRRKEKNGVLEPGRLCAFASLREKSLFRHIRLRRYGHSWSNLHRSFGDD